MPLSRYQSVVYRPVTAPFWQLICAATGLNISLFVYAHLRSVGFRFLSFAPELYWVQFRRRGTVLLWGTGHLRSLQLTPGLPMA